MSRALDYCRREAHLYAHTLVRMHPRQLAGIAERKLRERVFPAIPVDFDSRYESRVPEGLSYRTDNVGANTALVRDCLDDESRQVCRQRAQSGADGSPSFLNRTLEVADGRGVDWYHEDLDTLPRLWRLKFYGFEPLADLVLGYPPDADAKDLQVVFNDWIADWLAEVVVGERNYLRRAWTPYAVSLRLQHWIRYLVWCGGSGRRPHEKFERAFVREIYKNALFLSAHVEQDVGGNHLVENGAALVTTGLFFEGDHGFTDTGLSVLTKTTEQFLQDGCHYERSPMYHVLCLTRMLTVCDLLDRTGQTVPDSIRSITERATEFLAYLRPPDCKMPLLNDAVYGQSLSLSECLEYASAVGFDSEPGRPNVEGMDRGESSGYHWLDNDAGAMLVDGGPVGPPHLPGHAHSDLLSVLLWVDGYPVLTDAGTFDYEAGDRRRYARGVASHNTVQVEGTEPIALGGRFLMGHRPVPTTRVDRSGTSLFEGRYTAKPLEGPDYKHHRSVFGRDEWWLVWDTVSGAEVTDVCSRLHMHPGVDVRAVSDKQIRLEVGDDVEVSAYPLCGECVTKDIRPYFPEFGVAVDRPVFQLETSVPDRDRASSAVLMTTADTHPTVRRERGRPTKLTLDGSTYQLPKSRFPLW